MMIARVREHKAEGKPQSLAGVPHRPKKQVKTPGGYTRPQNAHQDLNQHDASAKFLAQQSAFTSRSCSIVEHEVSSSRGEATMTARHRAREIATFSRLRE